MRKGHDRIFIIVELADGQTVDLSFGDDKLTSTCEKVLPKEDVLIFTDDFEVLVTISCLLEDDLTILNVRSYLQVVVDTVVILDAGGFFDSSFGEVLIDEVCMNPCVYWFDLLLLVLGCGSFAHEAIITIFVFGSTV